MTANRAHDLLIALAAGPPLALLLLRERAIAGAAGFPLDDAWIHLHFARNLAEGAGFAYNPGVPVSGSTAPLWTLVLGAAAWLVGPGILVAKTLGVLAAIGAALLLRRAAVAWGAPPMAGLVAAIALLWTGPFAWGALSGMEVTLAALLVAAALLALARDRLIAAAIAGALATLARPESVLLLPLLLLGTRPTLRRAILVVLVVAAVLLPFLAFNWATVGRLVPATAAAKVEGGLLGWLAGVAEPWRRTWVERPGVFMWDWLRWLTLTHPLLPLAVPAIAVVWRPGRRALGVVALALVLQPLAMALLAPYREPTFQEGRYSIHLLPVALIVLAVASSRLPATIASTARVIYLAAALVALIPAADRYAWAVQNINAMQVTLGRWVDANVPRPATLAVNDIGAIAYFSRRPILDLMGLVTPEILPYRRDGEDGVIRFIAERCPDYVVIFPSWFPRLSARRDLLVPVHAVRLQRNEVSGAPEMVVYRLRRCAV